MEKNCMALSLTDKFLVNGFALVHVRPNLILPTNSCTSEVTYFVIIGHYYSYSQCTYY